MTPRKKILAISGSIRSHSTNESILRLIAEQYKDKLDVQLYMDIASLPHFNPDMVGENLPMVVKGFLARVADADGVIICTPEYVFSLPGTLKNAIEWAVHTTVFSDKPTALITASASGVKAHESLELVMRTLGCTIGPESSLLIQGSRSKVDPEGRLKDQTVMDEINTLMASFIQTLNEADKAASFLAEEQ